MDEAVLVVVVVEVVEVDDESGRAVGEVHRHGDVDRDRGIDERLERWQLKDAIATITICRECCRRRPLHHTCHAHLATQGL